MAEATKVPDRLVAERLRVERSGKVILRDVDVAAKTGEVLGVLGPSGAGKSTLFRALVGEIHADAGTVSLDGNDVTRWSLWRRARAGFGYIPQTPSVLWDMTVRENLIAFQRVVHGEVKSDVEKAATSVDLRGRLDVKAGVLSAGERRRLEFARALTRTPKVLICDEPFSGVDPVGAEKLGELLRDLATQDVLVLLADHHVAEALRICTRALLLLDGAIAVMADPESFEEHPLVQGRYLGTWRRTMPPPPVA